VSREVTTTKSVVLEGIAEVSGVPACDLRSNFSSSRFPCKLSESRHAEAQVTGQSRIPRQSVLRGMPGIGSLGAQSSLGPLSATSLCPIRFTTDPDEIAPGRNEKTGNALSPAIN
jgi:hypothetical protein